MPSAAPVATLLAAQPEAQELRDGVLGAVVGSPDLIDTLEARFDADGSTAEAAVRPHCHRNTVGYRLGRIAELTGGSVAPRGPRSCTRRCAPSASPPRSCPA